MEGKKDIDKENKRGLISVIVAIGRGRAIGKDNALLWHIPDDLKRFKALTLGHPVIMGRKTWESLPEKFRPLPSRTNIVITRQAEYAARGATVVNSLEEARAAAARAEGCDEIFIIGGAQLYIQALPYADRLYLTVIEDDKEGDAFFPEFENAFTKRKSEETCNWNDLKYTWLDLER